MVVYEIRGGNGGSFKASRSSNFEIKDFSILEILKTDKSELFILNASVRYLILVTLITRRFIYLEHTVFNLSNHSVFVKLIYNFFIRLPKYVVTPTREHLNDLGRLNNGFSFQLNLTNSLNPINLNLNQRTPVIRVIFWGRSDFQKNADFLDTWEKEIQNRYGLEFEFIILKDIFIDEEQFKKLIGSCHIYISTSRHESFNRVLYEATLSGLLTVVSDVKYGNRIFGMVKLNLDKSSWLSFFNDFDISEPSLCKYRRMQESALLIYRDYISANKINIEKFEKFIGQKYVIQ